MAESSDLPLTLQMFSCSLQVVGDDGRAWHDKRSKDRTKRNFMLRICRLKTNGGLIMGFI